MFGSIDINMQIPELIKDVGVPVAVAVFGVLGSIFVAALSVALSRWSDATARRRDGYAAARKTLGAYSECAWRVRRRTSDAPDELRRLAEVGHQLQEDLSYHQSWVRSENRWAGKVYAEVGTAMAAKIAPLVTEAWTMAPITTGADMNLGGWGPADLCTELERFERAVESRFGWRRFLAAVRWHIGA